MSSYYYDTTIQDRENSSPCSYHTLQDINKISKLPACLDRGNKERSEKDKLYYNFFVLGKPMNLRPQQGDQNCGPACKTGYYPNTSC